MMIMPNKPKTNFINLVKIIEVKDIDYIIQFVNTYSGETHIFKVYKELFDKAMEIRRITELDITTSNDEPKKENSKKEDIEPDLAMVYV